MEKVIAVVVTYNRANLLSNCINAIRQQTVKPHTILVINNGSTDHTEQWLSSQHDLQFITQKNVGSGGGFFTGINWAFRNKYTWIWCMDDDGYPKEDALENILAADTDQLCLRNCAVLNNKDKRSFVWKTNGYATISEVPSKLIYGVGHPFNGTLLHRSIVERVGLPDAKLFLWGDETEYYYRITRANKIPVCTVTDSIHYHPASACSIKNDWDHKKSWKMYYYVRNRLQIHQSKFNNPALALTSYCLFLLAMVAVVMIYQRTDRMKKIVFLLWPANDAFSNNYQATPLFIQRRLAGNRPNRYRYAANTYFSNIYASFFARPQLSGSQRDTNS
jgi:rhamnopyranosyl-N-acetylglucosaminyl-diphospho-decaprenol beta-1,3/1,4-galactofuranosyltransferase